MKTSLSFAYAFILIIGDYLAILAAFALAYILRVSLGSDPFLQVKAIDYARIFLLISPFWILTFGLLGLYHRDVYEWRLKEFGRLLVGSVIGIMSVISYDFFSPSPLLPARIIPIYGLVIGYLLLVLFRTILRGIRGRLRRRGFGLVNVMLIGDNAVSHELALILHDSVHSGYRLVALVGNKDVEPPHFRGSRFTSISRAIEMLPELDVHTVVLAKLFSDETENERLMAAAQANHCALRFVPSNEGLINQNVDVELFQGVPVVSVHSTKLVGWGRIVKRLFDMFVALVGLIVFAPLMLVIYVALLFTGSAPVYKRQRLTRYGHSFNIYKFRTIKIDYNGLDPEAGFAKMGRPDMAVKFRENGDFLDRDPRISRLGALLRNSSLDELPQLINILRGDISLVGPRSLIAEELENYAYKNLILSVKSGLTGLAQISGRKGLRFEERRRLDLFYVQNWSFWLDLKILFRTLLEVFTGRGAA